MSISIYGIGAIDTEDARITLANTALILPTGNTLQRPSPASAGMIRFNNQSNVFEAYNGTIWANIALVLPEPNSTDLQYVVVAGGGGGGLAGGGGGGGGAGGLLANTLTVSKNISYTITVGAGGAASTGQYVSLSSPLAAKRGSNSSITASNISIISIGGGGGSSSDSSAAYSSPGQPGGSGGGGAQRGPAATAAGGLGTAGQGNAGGASPSPGGDAGGGGGGASQSGSNAPSNTAGGKGGDGFPSLLTGANVFYAGGGGGGGGGTGGNGGAGGGGTGGGTPSATAGTVNTGGGGGGNGSPATTAGAGGSGIIVLSHTSSLFTNATVSVGLTYTKNTINSNTVYIFTAGTGTITWN